jgi:hypothetical protein
MRITATSPVAPAASARPVVSRAAARLGVMRLGVACLCAALLWVVACQSPSPSSSPDATQLQGASSTAPATVAPMTPSASPSTASSSTPSAPADTLTLPSAYDDPLILSLPSQGEAQAPYHLLTFIDVEDASDRNFLRELDLLRMSMPTDALLIQVGVYPKEKACNAHISRTLSPSACLSAAALLCAQDIQLGWPMLGKLRAFFDARDQQPVDQRVFLSESDVQGMLSQIATQTPSDQLAAFPDCVTSASTLKRVSDIAARASDLGVGSTPAWRINGIRPSIPALSAAHKLQAFIQQQPPRTLPE